MHDISELAVISCLITRNEDIVDVSVTADQFTNSTYGMIFQAIKSMLGENQIVDLFTLADFLGRTSNVNNDWFSYLSDIAVNASASAKNLKGYCAAIQKAHSVRQAKMIGQALIDNAKEDGAIGNAIKNLMLMGRESLNYEYGINEAMKIGLQAIQDAADNGGKLLGVNTGLTELNEVLGGWHPGDLIIVGARPAMGKTSVLLNMLFGAQESVGVFSGEQGIGQIIQRLISIESKVSLMSMRNGNVDIEGYHNLQAGALRIKAHPGIRFFDQPSPSIDEIEFTSRRWKQQYNIKALYVDYLQKIKKDPKKSKIEAISDNVSRLKDLARELDIPIICLAQVNRSVEQRPDKRPNMGDLADTSETEKEADQIIMLYRDEVYNPDTDYPGVMELSVEKNRHGSTGLIRAAWDGRYLSVSDMNYVKINEQQAQESTSGFIPQNH